MSDLVLTPQTPPKISDIFSFLPLEASGEIAGDKDFSGFLTASELAQALESNPSTNLSVVVENETPGQIDHLLEGDRPQIELEEPQANSTLIEPVDVAAVPADNTDAEIVRRERKRAKRRQYRQRRSLTRSLSNLSTNPNGEGSQETVAGPSQTPGTAVPPAAKREKSSPGETSAPKRPRTGPEGGAPGQHSFKEAASKALFLSIVPLDSEGNDIGATDSDRKFVVEKLEQYIAKSGPNINIMECSLRGRFLRVQCLNQKTLESVKRVVCPLKGPRGNLQGYKCLAPGDKPPLVTYGVWVEVPVPKKNQLLPLLKDANDWVNPKKMVVKAVIPKEGKGATFLVGVEPEMRAELLRRNFKLRYGAGRTAHFKLKPKGRQAGGR